MRIWHSSYWPSDYDNWVFSEQRGWLLLIFVLYHKYTKTSPISLIFSLLYIAKLCAWFGRTHVTLRLESCPQSPDFDRQDYIVLNSVANVPKALYPLGSYERIHCFFDNDRAGMEAIQQIRKEYDATRYIRDASQIYSGCKDLNEYLQKRIADRKEQAQSVEKRNDTLSKKPKGFRL